MSQPSHQRHLVPQQKLWEWSTAYQPASVLPGKLEKLLSSGLCVGTNPGDSVPLALLKGACTSDLETVTDLYWMPMGELPGVSLWALI